MNIRIEGADIMEKYRLLVGLGSCGIAAGAQTIYDNLKNYLKQTPQPLFTLDTTGCLGMCYKEPLVNVIDPQGHEFVYGEVDQKKVDQILKEHIQNHSPIREWLVKADEPTSEESYYINQVKIVLENSGRINPERIEEYLAYEGYSALRKVLEENNPRKIIDTIKESGLRGRGGGGFPTGLKWEFAFNATGAKKYIICNGDEGDPGAFMDRSVMESDPHRLLEGMTIAALAIGANEGYIYVRAEYPLAIKNLRRAIAQAEDHRFVGNQILGTPFCFNLHIKEGAGAFVCGEETALMASIEGKRGMPRFRPPFPAQAGLWGYPTNINNVETYANIPWIIRQGAAAFRSHGTEKSPGTKVFALAGKIKRGGLIEVSMGIPLRDIIYKIGGGIKDGKAFKAVQLGGPSGGCIPAALADTIIDYDSVNATGAIMGSGGMIVMDETTCMIDIARFFLRFTQNESCGKCTFCRVGTRRMLEILDRISSGEGKEDDIPLLEELAYSIKKASLCGLGQTAPNPVLTTLKYFKEEYLQHIRDKKCPAGVCKALIEYKIDEAGCIGCTLCARNCPVNAISGKPKGKHVIDPSVCTRCGICKQKCPVNAIYVI